MFDKELLSAISGVLFFVAFIPYILAILHKKARPQKTSWIIWAILDWITFIGMLKENSLNWHITGACIGASTIAILAMIYGETKWKKEDKICLIAASIAIVLMFLNPVYSILISLCGLFIGAIPTFKSVWKEPENEDKLAWTLYWISCVMAIIAIPKWTLEDAGQPITFFIIESVVLYAIYFRAKKSLKKIIHSQK